MVLYLNECFAASLRGYRKALKLSQETLAELADLDRSFISLLERGVRNPSLQTIMSLAKAMNITPVEFIEDIHTRINKEHEKSK